MAQQINAAAQRYMDRAQMAMEMVQEPRDYQRVINELNNALAEAPNHPIIIYNLAISHDGMGVIDANSYKKAIEYYRQFLAFNPSEEDRQDVVSRINRAEYAIEASISQSVLINGVRWATRNVDAPGTFATNPESSGRFYQWNRRTGWATTGNVSGGWDRSNPSGTSWIRTNDPCPQGWRVPTKAELESLYNAGSVWTTRNGINGRFFGSEPNQIFLSAAGWRVDFDGTLLSAGTEGIYWGSNSDHNEAAIGLVFNTDRASTSGGRRSTGYSVRCVADGNITEQASTLPLQTVAISDISLNRTSVSLVIGASETLTATISPNNATNQNVTWSSRNPAVATVNSSGQITAVAAGRTNIFVFASDGGLTAWATITVEAPALSSLPQAESVVINGVRWATHNVASPGTFAASPESTGMHYQWNRRTAWALTGTRIGWDTSPSSGTSWTRDNDPCPAGWRVPTQSELQSLANAGSVWNTLNGAYGRLFGTAPNQIFLPAAGWRDNGFGMVDLVGGYGCYWSSTPLNARDGAWYLGFISTNMLTDSDNRNHYRANGYSVRCVAEE
ncbi:MAG: Ig-like domain-containing protein [Dysgonamonadaceae bacterium]|nr:Ig-like domain-containing protein [Dysgonamonadaceae bacterium]